MSHRSRLAQHKAALSNGLAAAQPSILRTAVAPNPPPGQLGIDQLVPALLSQGAGRGYAVQFDAVNKVVRLNASCGPITIPLDFTPDETRALSVHLMQAADTVDPPMTAEQAQAAAWQLLAEKAAPLTDADAQDLEAARLAVDGLIRKVHGLPEPAA